jgi:hypothetical protein
MSHDITDAGEFQHGLAIQDRVIHEMKQGVGGQMPDIVQASRRQIVNDVDFVTASQISFRKVRTNETGSARDENFQDRLLPRSIDSIMLPLYRQHSLESGSLLPPWKGSDIHQQRGSKLPHSEATGL